MMSLGSQEGEIPIAIPPNYGTSMHESAKLKLLSSSNGRSLEEIKPLEIKGNKLIKYRECQKNHAANIGAHALDGCGEFMPSGEEGALEALKCAACNCHRNFHRREVEGDISCGCHHIGNEKRGASSPILVPHPAPLAVSSAGAIPSRIPASMIMALSTGAQADSDDQDGGYFRSPSSLRKRFRTKFSNEQKDKMLSFADKLGWKFQKHDEAEVQQFCEDTGVKRHVLKVWMHNNKHTLGKRLL
ncbi:hypothetical protein O6H91_11G003200 [Diphasiastrum complanatum]|uniref:Uncharacterized protein n=3 Tax=Diphasiastrum complanatum TaxID=34168 RepID=A0ACC2C5Q2_DIPCM|nr:hypothetical protein O6H91_11G003200 [Diphasiastrum complanatum]